MGLCESNNSSNNSSSKKHKINPLKPQFSSDNNNNKNLFCSPIGSSNNLNNKKMSLSNTQITLGNQSNYIRPPKPKPYIYNNTYNSKNSITSNGISGNSFTKGYSKLNNNSLSISNSYGELIIENQLNPEIKENQNFKDFFNSNDKDINASNNNNINDNDNENDKDENKKNKRNLNLYHQYRKNKSNDNVDKNYKNKITPIPLDSD